MNKTLKCFAGALILAAALSSALTAQAAPAMKAHGPHAAVPCATCHADGKFTAPTKETCLKCHGSYAKVAERTAKMTPNPHASHRGEPQCTNCHSMHAQPRFECNDCHNFKIQMKGE